MISTPYRNHNQFIEILIPLIFSSFVILMPLSIQYHLLNNLIDIWWCGVIIQPLRSICLPLWTAFYSVFFVFAALFQCNQGQQDGKVGVVETAGGPALTNRWMRTRARENFFLHFDQWQMTDSIKKREKDARQKLPTGDTGDKWQRVRAAWVEGRWGWCG